MSTRTVPRTAAAAAVAAGLAASALTDGALVLLGAGSFRGPLLGVLAAPLLLLLAHPSVRRGLRADPATALLIAGSAWTLAPFADQHLTGAIVLDGTFPDVVHHLAGWTALAAGSLSPARPRARSLAAR